MSELTFAWHVHHNELLEPLTGSLEKRIVYIKSEKPPGEVETRLRLFKPVKGSLPAAIILAGEDLLRVWEVWDQAGRAYKQAWEAYQPTWEAYDQAEEAYDQALAAYYQALTAYAQAGEAYHQEIQALHSVECPDCPWDGRTILEN